MSRRIAHRPRHHLMRNYPQSPLRSHKEYLRTRWTYHRQALPYPRRPLGHGLMVIPWGFRLVRDAIKYHA